MTETDAVFTGNERAIGDALVRLQNARSEAEATLARNALRYACKAYTDHRAEPVNEMVTWAARRGPVIVQEGQRVSLATLLRWKPNHPRDGARVRFANGRERTFPLHNIKKAKEDTKVDDDVLIVRPIRTTG